jgi:hypothetical protein
MTSITYYLEGSKEYLIDRHEFVGAHPGQAIAHAQKLLSKNARSQYDAIKIYSLYKGKKLLGQVLFRAANAQNQCIDWLPAKAPPFQEHQGEIRAHGIDGAARRGVTHKQKR